MFLLYPLHLFILCLLEHHQALLDGLYLSPVTLPLLAQLIVLTLLLHTGLLKEEEFLRKPVCEGGGGGLREGQTQVQEVTEVIVLEDVYQ